MRSQLQPWPIRVTHWANLVLLTVMAGSGLRILAAYPFLGAQGAVYGWYPLQGESPPGSMTLGGWLAGARHWHFAFAWLFVANAVVYFAHLFASGEWRRRLFHPRRDARNAWGTLLHDLHLRREAPPPVGLYNGMQRLAYSATLATAPLAILSGLAMHKPVQLPWLAGADPRARYVEFRSFDSGYWSSWDLESTLHPQTILAYGMDGASLPMEHGAPLRLYSAVKLGYKMVKYLTEVSFLPSAPAGTGRTRGTSGSAASDLGGGRELR